MTPAQRLRAQIERRARQQAPELAVEMMRAWDRLAKDLNAAEIARLISTADFNAIYSRVLDDAVLDRVFAEVQREYFKQTAANMEYFGKSIGVKFGVLNPAIISEFQKLDLKMAFTLKDDVRAAVRVHIEAGLKAGINPRTMARGVRDVVGLTETQARWVDNFRDELQRNSRAALKRALGRGVVTRPDGSIITRGAHAGGFGLNRKEMGLLNRVLGSDQKLTPAQVDRLVGQYRKRLTAWHAESISRTAALDGLKAGQHESTRQAVADGILDADRMMSEWVTTLDGRERPEHHALNGTVVVFGHPFPTGDVIPGASEYGCRCVKRDFQATRSEMERYARA